MFTMGASAFSRRGWLRCLALAALLASPLAASARTILVIAPHPDDETLIAAGRVRAAVEAGDTAKIAVITNGDIAGHDLGLLRETESVAAAQLLGLTEPDVIFLGYGDSTLQTLYLSGSGSQVYTSPIGLTATYGASGLGGMDFHSYWLQLHGEPPVPGPYSRDGLLQDLEDLIGWLRPDEIYTVAPMDMHTDHMAAAMFVIEALVDLQRAGAALPTRLFQTVVWVGQTGGSSTAGRRSRRTGSRPPPPSSSRSAASTRARSRGIASSASRCRR